MQQETPIDEENQSVSRRGFLRSMALAGAVVGGAGLLVSPSVLPSVKAITSSVEPASYIVYRQGSTIYAQNGTTGAIDYSGTDAAIVFNNAMNALAPNGGGTIFVRTGAYSISSSLNVPSGISLVGESTSDAGCVLIATSGSINVVNVTGGYWCLSNMKISGGGLSGNNCIRLAGNSGIMFNIRCTDADNGVYVDGGSYWKIIGCLVGGHKKAAILFHDGGVNSLITESNIDFTNQADGILVDQPITQRVEGLVISNNVILSPGNGIRIVRGLSIFIVNNIIDQTVGESIKLGNNDDPDGSQPLLGLREINIVGNYIASAKGRDWSSVGISSGAFDVLKVVGNKIDQNAAQGLRVMAYPGSPSQPVARYVLIQGNSFEGNNNIRKQPPLGAGEADIDSAQDVRFMNNFCISKNTANSYAELGTVYNPTGLVLGNKFPKGAVYRGSTTQVYNFT